MTTTYDLTIDQGATYTLPVQVLGINGTGYDLTGYTVRSQMRATYSASVSMSFTGTLTNASDGHFNLTMPADQTAAISASTYVYDTEIVSGSFVARVLKGKALVTPEVTR